MSENRLKIGITQGDPNGIGWEVILKTFADPRMTELCTPVIYGSLKAAEFYQKTIADLEPVPFHIASSIHEIRRGICVVLKIYIFYFEMGLYKRKKL